MSFNHLRRRQFITLLSGAAMAWPLAARAQQGERLRRIGVLMTNDETDSEAKLWVSELIRALAELGWTDGRNLRMDIRWARSNVDRLRTLTKELVETQPNVILASGTPATAALQRETLTIPIVFVLVADPVGSGFVAGLPRPGKNITGFGLQEASMAGKWLELLTEISPGVKLVAAMFNPDTAPFVGSYFLPVFEAAARSRKVEPIVAPVHSDAEIETVISALGREPGGGLIVLPDTFTHDHQALIISLTTRNNVASVYWDKIFVRNGGLVSYGVSLVDIFRRGAAYVDRILRGANPSELPVQLPAKFELAVNIKTAKALGLAVPPSILLRADEVIE
jgi:putative ABC transport system substrate-binding protein